VQQRSQQVENSWRDPQAAFARAESEVQTGTGLAPAHICAAPGPASPRLHLNRDVAHPAHICDGTGLAPATSAPGRGSLFLQVNAAGYPFPPLTTADIRSVYPCRASVAAPSARWHRLQRGWAHPCHSCTGTGLTPPTSAPGPGLPRPHLHRDWGSPLPHLHRDGARPPTSAPGRGSPAPTSAPGLPVGLPLARPRGVAAVPFGSPEASAGSASMVRPESGERTQAWATRLRRVERVGGAERRRAGGHRPGVRAVRLRLRRPRRFRYRPVRCRPSVPPPLLIPLPPPFCRPKLSHGPGQSSRSVAGKLPDDKTLRATLEACAARERERERDKWERVEGGSGRGVLVVVCVWAGGDCSW
jgi:hypothetical protein